MIVFYKSSFLKMVVFKMAVFQNDRFFIECVVSLTIVNIIVNKFFFSKTLVFFKNNRIKTVANRSNKNDRFQKRWLFVF